MASILDRYGIKEVADVTFYELDGTGTPTRPVLYLDTLKVSTIEQTAETSDARGGKGNAALISWDYGKEITVTLEDALFSAKSMAIMFGNGYVKSYNGNMAYLMKTEQFKAKGTVIPNKSNDYAPGTCGWDNKFTAPDGKRYDKTNPKFFDSTGTILDGSKENPDVFTVGETYFCTYDLLIDGAIIDVSADSFPGTYYVTGDTYARSDASGRDEFFQFIVPKAKVQSENTITLEAEGDPSVFNMSLKVLRPADGVMMKLVKYDLAGVGTSVSASTTGSIFHNHDLTGTDHETIPVEDANV